ncbi:MAG: transporter [Rhizobacter sp.]|nr:transporter [Rhizobacter sp.]
MNSIAADPTSSTIPPSATALFRARRALRVQFFGMGFMFATWGVHIPTVKQRYGVGESALGLAILAMGIGSLLGLSQAGRLIARFGARRVLLVTGIANGLGLACLLSLPSFAVLMAVLFVMGMVGSVFDVAMNAEASRIESLEKRPLMSGFHGMFSLGGMAGAGVGAALLNAGVPPALHLAGMALLLTLAISAACSRLLTSPPPSSEPSHFALPRGVLLLLGVMAGIGLIAEGAMYDWSVLYLNKELGAPQDRAALAYASFSAAMAAARFGGDALRRRFAPGTLLRASGALAAVSMAAVLLSHHWAIALLGFALVGVGFANIVPVLFSAAGRVPDTNPAQAIASVSSLGYCGFMCGPPIIGFVAQHTSLSTALWLVVGFACVLGAAAGRVPGGVQTSAR